MFLSSEAIITYIAMAIAFAFWLGKQSGKKEEREKKRRF